MISTFTVEHDQVMGHLLESQLDMKTMYKSWHLAYNKQYDYNTIEGINKYKNFKTNVKAIRAHNAENLSWKQGLNEYSDMTEAEFKAYFNLGKELKTDSEVRKLMSLDDYNDETDTLEARSDIKNTGDVKKTDWRSYTMPVRNQQNCGSCWSFATMAIIESAFNQKYPALRLRENLSTQMLVDCDKKNSGCNGGWYTNAIKYFYNNDAAYESKYPYQARVGHCHTVDTTATDMVRTKSYNYSRNKDSLLNLLSKGAVAIAVDANSKWYSYKSGLFDEPCTASGVNHAVVLVGYGYEGEEDGDDNDDDNNDDDNNDDCVSQKAKTTRGAGYYIIRNSWGTSWGEQGHMRLKDNRNNNYSCYVEKYGYVANIK